MADIGVTGAFDKMLKLFNLANTCEDSLERCFDEVCADSDQHPAPAILKKISQNMVDSFIKTMATRFPKSGISNWTVGQKRAHFFMSFKETFCESDKALVKSPVPQEAPATEPAKFEINVTVEDAARAGAFTAGAKLVYDVLVFGATIFPAARPAAQGIMMLFGMTPTGIEYESPSDRMSREGA